jgi:hypothetical protein
LLVTEVLETRWSIPASNSWLVHLEATAVLAMAITSFSTTFLNLLVLVDWSMVAPVERIVITPMIARNIAKICLFSIS